MVAGRLLLKGKTLLGELKDILPLERYYVTIATFPPSHRAPAFWQQQVQWIHDNKTTSKTATAATLLD